MSNYAVILAARMGSERLPGKALASYCPNGMSNLEQIIGRWRESDRAPTLVVAITTARADDELWALCLKLGVPCYRGEAQDVVARIDGALKTHAPQAEYVARALADNPLVDVALADGRLDVLEETGADGTHWGGQEERITYAATTDIWRRAAWDEIAVSSTGEQREHPGLYYWQNLHRFSTVALPLPRREYVTRLRTELDTALDLEMFGRVWQAWGREESLPTLWALKWLAAHPEVAALNAEVPVKTQARAVWGKGQAWLCKNCQQRVGAIVAGDLEVRCTGCGKPQKFYARPPAKQWPVMKKG